MKEKYNTKAFKFFMRKLKKDKLWNRFRILEYYFHVYVPDRVVDRDYINSFTHLYEAIKHPECYEIKNEEYTIFPMNEYITLKEIFDYYRV